LLFVTAHHSSDPGSSSSSSPVFFFVFSTSCPPFVSFRSPFYITTSPYIPSSTPRPLRLSRISFSFTRVSYALSRTLCLFTRVYVTTSLYVFFYVITPLRPYLSASLRVYLRSRPCSCPFVPSPVDVYCRYAFGLHAFVSSLAHNVCRLESIMNVMMHVYLISSWTVQ
jgi:hypothetical protein